MRVLLVPVADRPECVVALNSTFNIAKRMGADVVGVHIRTHRDMETTLPGGNFLNQLIGEHTPWDQVSESDAKTASEDAQELFAKIAKHHDYPLSQGPAKDLSPVASWREKVGKAHFIMPIIGPASDMLVLSRPNTENKGGRKASAFLNEALLHTNRPVLVLPQDKELASHDHIAIAWNKSADAARVLHASLCLIKSAKKVSFITVGQTSHIGPSADDMIGFLSHHGVEAERVNSRSPDNSEEIMRIYNDIGANLLVMGAYSRPRLAELVFGGATDHMLREANIPVLMMHS